MSDRPARRVDEWGRAIYSEEAAFRLMHEGADVTAMLIEDGPDVRAHNAACRLFRKGGEIETPTPLDVTPEEEFARRASTWKLPPEFQNLDMRSVLLSLCDTDEQRDRVNEEMDLYEARGLVPLLRTMAMLVCHWREHGIVWGIGRGSSVASYCLYLLGVSKIDPMRYGLKITDFLR